MTQDKKQDKEMKLEEWLEKINEPLKPLEEKTVKQEDLSDRKYWNLMDEGLEQEDYQEEKKPKQEKYKISGSDYNFNSRKKYERC